MTRPASMLRTARIGGVAAIVGYGLLAVYTYLGFTSGAWPIPSGDVTNFLQAGRRLLGEGPIYVGTWDGIGTVYYAPPVMVLLAGLSYLPWELVWVGLVMLDVAGLRYLAGSWTRVGWLAVCPLTILQLASGNPNFAVVAAILLAHRRHAGPLVLAALAKLGPFLGIPVRRWRQALVWALVAVVITVPWLRAWPEWIAFLAGAPKDPGWPTIIPLLLRLPFVLLLLGLRRPWAQMLAACVAIPGFYVVTVWATGILAWRLWLDRRLPVPVGERLRPATT